MKLDKKNKKELIWLAAAAVLLVAAIALSRLFGELSPLKKAALFLPAFITAGFVVLKNAAYGLMSGELFDENFLMSIASIGAFALGEHIEAVMVMLLYRIGELLQSMAVGKSRNSIAQLIDICPESVNLEKDGSVISVEPDEVEIGDIMLVKAGERIAVDGTVISGSSALDTAALTGEALPVDITVGDKVKSGCINLNGVIRVSADCVYGNSTVARMMELIEGASANKAKSEKFITRFARVYTPIVVLLGILLAILPPVLMHASFKVWLYRALNFLVISCPCALVISVPLAFFGGIGAASKNGILVKGSNCLETLDKCNQIAFDKTGTLTKGTFRVSKLLPSGGFDEDELLYIAACVETMSNHPIARCVVSEYDRREKREKLAVSSYKEIAGKGIIAECDRGMIAAGNDKLMRELGIDEVMNEIGFASVIHIALNSAYIGSIAIEDELKNNAKQTISQLKTDMGIKCVMLTGDRAVIGESVANELSLDKVFCELLPEDKVREIERLIASNGGKTTAYVGDGINDAAVIARADAGFAMGALGSDAAIEAADIVLTDDSIERIPLAIKIAKRTVSIAKQNIVFAIAVKLVVMLLGALGFASLWMAILADVGVCIAAVCNAMRAARTPA